MTDKKPKLDKSIVIDDPKAEEFQIMEALDDKLIVAELGGEMVKEWVYSFKLNGKEVQGLSYVGVRESVRELNKKGSYEIRISPEHPPIIQKVTEGHDLYDPQVGEGFVAMVYGEDRKNGGGLWATKFEAINKKKRDGGTYKNPFAYEQALSKAQRNALESLIPKTLLTKLMHAFLEAGKGKNLSEKEARDVVGAMSPLANELLTRIESCTRQKSLSKIGDEIAAHDKDGKLSATEMQKIRVAFAARLNLLKAKQKSRTPKKTTKKKQDDTTNAESGGDSEASDGSK